MTNRDMFIEVADSLPDAYENFGRCLYSEVLDEGVLEPVFNFMKSNSTCTTDEVLFYLEGLLESSQHNDCATTASFAQADLALA